jgi:hypothetical protein
MSSQPRIDHDPSDGLASLPVLRGRGLEIVDETGMVRAVIGPLPEPHPGRSEFGIALMNTSGRPRVWLSLREHGTALVFDLGGNNVLSLGIHDPGDDSLHVGAYLRATDADGTPVFGFNVEDDGGVMARLGGPTRPD